MEDSEERAGSAPRLALEEQRRLAYVGMTRARDLLVIALPRRQAQARRLAAGHRRALPCSPKADALALPHGTSVPTIVRELEATKSVAEAGPFAPALVPRTGARRLSANAGPALGTPNHWPRRWRRRSWRSASASPWAPGDMSQVGKRATPP